MKNQLINFRISNNAKVCLSELAEPKNLSEFILSSILQELKRIYKDVPVPMLIALLEGRYKCMNDFERECTEFLIRYEERKENNK